MELGTLGALVWHWEHWVAVWDTGSTGLALGALGGRAGGTRPSPGSEGAGAAGGGGGGIPGGWQSRPGEPSPGAQGASEREERGKHKQANNPQQTKRAESSAEPRRPCPKGARPPAARTAAALAKMRPALAHGLCSLLLSLWVPR